MNWLFWAETVGIAYVLWLFFVLALTSSLKEIKKSSWHYKLSYFLFSERNYWGTPRDRSLDINILRNTCRYGGRLLLAPLGLIWVLSWVIVIVPIRLFFHWLLVPFFAGNYPETGSGKHYLYNLFDFVDMESIETESFMPLSPFLWFLISGIVVGLGIEISRIIGGDVSGLEFWLFVGACLAVAVVIGLIVLFTRPSVKTMWAMLREKLCRMVPVTE